MIDKVEKKQLAILRVIRDAGRPLTGSMITEELTALGVDISERTVRLYMLAMDQEGLTENLGKKGRRITERGIHELEDARIIEKVGLLSAKIDQMTFTMDFDLKSRTGTVVINVTLSDPDQFTSIMPQFCRVYKEGYAMGRLMTLLQPGERVGDILVPEGKVGIGTVCSITLNGVLLQHGVPVTSRFGGLLEIRDKKPTRFVEMITYDGTSIDPLEVFIRSGMTDYIGATETGNGRIGASFREFPAAGRNKVKDLARRLEEIGLGGFMRIGFPGQQLLEIPVIEGRVGAIVIGGLNPVSVFEETGRRVYSRALAGLISFDRLFHYAELEDRLRKL
ncbi:MAG: DUF128 domain-containing protein [Deltaproteobacteria bacterium]|nr:DUF128 domain-containing protein [Deltaproteobacteria bacterium]